MRTQWGHFGRAAMRRNLIGESHRLWKLDSEKTAQVDESEVGLALGRERLRPPARMAVCILKKLLSNYKFCGISMRELWPKLHDLFDTDDGSLADIIVENLKGDQVSAVYKWIRSQSDIYCDEGPPLLWDRIAERDVAIPALEDPVALLLGGKIEPFRHGLNPFAFNEVEIPQLTVAVWPTSIDLDYRMGPEWGPAQVAALFEFLWAIHKIAPDATISHVDEGGSTGTEKFAAAWDNFTRHKNATEQLHEPDP